ncbi:uncharacterized protein BDZ99DRAFT_527229 [Mytilinidion resinicola]|uniref:Uncharacterized protein n=1 Tax=Mytilinidion resinicola TaxID=574789 RepID=A0A6A6Y1V6_9PEZI|nr:uncharacterized protein BDZ99DRAFT_527229 [Mytilinidion resinicola]KAF2802796.1 hypothetical protein BDZ99DRAFT_527229 [Mytilinidion resinicola]
MEHLISTIKKIWTPLPDHLIPVDISPREDYNPHQINLSHWPPIDLLQRVQIIAQVIGEKDYSYAHARMRRAVDIRVQETEEDGEEYCGEGSRIFEAQDASALIKELRLEKQGRSKAPGRAALLAEYGAAIERSEHPEFPTPATEEPPAVGEDAGKQKATGHHEGDDFDPHLSNSTSHQAVQNPTPESSPTQIQVQAQTNINLKNSREFTDKSRCIDLTTPPHSQVAQQSAPVKPVQKRKRDGVSPPPESTRNVRRVPQSWLSSQQTNEEDLPRLHKQLDNVAPFAPKIMQDYGAKTPDTESSIIGQEPAAPDATAMQSPIHSVSPQMPSSSSLSSAPPQSSPSEEGLILEKVVPLPKARFASWRRKEPIPRQLTQEDLDSDEGDDDPYDGTFPARHPAFPSREDNLMAQVSFLKLENERLKASQAGLHESLATLVKDLHQRQTEINDLKIKKTSKPEHAKQLKAAEDKIKELGKEIRDLQSRPLAITEIFVQTLDELRERMLLSFSDEDGMLNNEDIQKLQRAIHASNKGASDATMLQENLARDKEVRDQAEQRLEAAEMALQEYLEGLSPTLHAELMSLIGDLENARDAAVAAERAEERSQDRLSRHNLMKMRADQYNYLAEQKNGGLNIDPLMRDLLVPIVRLRGAVGPSTSSQAGMKTRSGCSAGEKK